MKSVQLPVAALVSTNTEERVCHFCRKNLKVFCSGQEMCHKDPAESSTAC